MLKLKKIHQLLLLCPTLALCSPCHKLDKPVGVGVLLVRQDQVFLLKRAYKDWGFGVVAGVLGKEETLRQSAIRHVEKEVGIKLKESDLNFVCCVHYKPEDDEEAPLVFFLSTENWTGEPINKEPDRHDQAQWFPLDLLPSHLAPSEDLVFSTYKTCGPNPNAYLERGWNREPCFK
jgi:ADP-ribose pyrophosphatase YjhB (NUDIX family)